jgi:hypothetical protein
MEIQTFRDFPLKAEVLKAIEDLGFEEVFPIQAQAICPLLEGKDVIGQAQTGTGKTAAFEYRWLKTKPELRKVRIGLGTNENRRASCPTVTFSEIRQAQSFGDLAEANRKASPRAQTGSHRRRHARKNNRPD